MKKIALTVALVGALVASAVAARADIKDSWITTKAKIALLTTDGFSVNGANVDTFHGNVTIHGKVGTTADRTRAEQTVRKVDGVKNVKNLLTETLRAIENAYSVNGVHRVASDIQTIEN